MQARTFAVFAMWLPVLACAQESAAPAGSTSTESPAEDARQRSLLAKTQAQIEDVLNHPLPPAFGGDLSIGFIRTSGTTNATTLNGKGDLEYKNAPWDNVTSAQLTYASSDNDTTADSYLLADKLTRDLSPKDYLFGSLNYVNDHFAGIRESISEAAGYGRHILNTPTHVIDVDLGAGAGEERDQGDNKYVTQPIAVFDFNYLWNLTQQSHFKHTLHVEAGSNNTFVDPLTELKLDIIGNVFATLDYEIRYNTTVPENTPHTTSTTSLNIGYTFGKVPTPLPVPVAPL